jgi:superfamily II DNA/RNA helicase
MPQSRSQRTAYRGAPSRPARRQGGPSRSAGSRTSTTTYRAVPSEFDRALEAALEAPMPPERTFADLGLPAPVVRSLAARGIHAPFSIQARTLPDALAGRDVLGRAQTGSGKTLAFGLPMLARLAGGSSPRREGAPRGLVLVPTRELASQVTDVLAPLGQALGLRVTAVYGGASIGRQIDRMRRGVEVVVATPGRLIDLLERGACVLDHIEIAVLDEADHMADLGFLPAVTRLLDATPAGGQRLLFSATLDRGVETIVRRYLTDPAIHAVAVSAALIDAMDHQVFVLPAQDKIAVAAEIGGRPGRTLFFVRTKHGADKLAIQLTRAGVAAAAIHGNLNQNQRQRALASFAAGHPRVLVATDVAARGIHVDDVDLVVHYDPPNDHKDYLHRSGRTARAGARGTVVALVEPGQVRALARLHDAAGVTPVSHRVTPGHDAVRDVSVSGTPVPPLVELPTAPASGGGRDRAGAPGRPRPGRARRGGRQTTWRGGRPGVSTSTAGSAGTSAG